MPVHTRRTRSSSGRSGKAAQSAVTREAILASSLHLFARHGVAGTSIDEIAGAAGITKGAIYWHFDSKDALFDAILELIRTRWQDAVMQPVAGDGPATARLQQVFTGYARLFGETPDICFFMQRVLLEGDEAYSPRIARVFRQTARFIAGILDAGKAAGEFKKAVDSTHVAHSVLAGIAGATQQRLVNPAFSLESLLDESRRMTLALVAR